MDTKAAIETFLKSSPGPHKARAIASAINGNVSAVNSVLYKHLNRTFTKTPDFRWTLVSADDRRKTPPNRSEARAAGGNERLNRLCRYYLACIAKDSANDVSEWAASKFEKPSYAELAQLPIAVENGDVWSDDNAQRLIRSFRNERGRLAMFVGYPTRLRRFQSRKGDVFYRVEPIVLFEYKLPEDGSGWPVLADERAALNHAAIKELTGATGPEVLEEISQLSAELGLDAAGLDAEDVLGALENLAAVRPDWAWREPLDPTNTRADVALAQTTEDGLYNRAMLVLSERSPYTRGLETELTALATQTAIESGHTALTGWLDGKLESKKAGEDDLIEVVPLNVEQREAVRRALCQPLTVVTGPPGTGKSQVVASIIANCIWKRQTVLFASKNNKAVDVVHARVNALGPRPVLLRIGTGDATTGLAQHLAAILAGTATAEDEANLAECRRKYDFLLAERAPLQQELDRIVALRNLVDDLDQKAEEARTTLGPDCFARLRIAIPSSTARDIERANKAVEAAIPERQSFLPRLFWSWIASERTEQAQRSLDSLRPSLEHLGMGAPPTVAGRRSAEAALPVLLEAQRRLMLANIVCRYSETLSSLTQTATLEDVSARKYRIAQAMRSSSEELWDAWLRLQPKRLNATQRKALGEYKSVLEMLANTPYGQGGSLLRQAQALFPRLVETLPAWAVTNLSARGRLPFSPGYFDVLIIDEASQCDIASALPLLFRAKRAVIIGDPMQLQHITQLSAQIEQQLLDDHGIHQDPGPAWAYSGSSLFNLASTLCEGDDIISLRDHHRSHADIIGFSNKHFYEDRLRVATRYDKLHPRPAGDPAVRWVNVAGRAARPSSGGAFNEIEARRVVVELDRLLSKMGYRGTIGVVSPFRAQANRIRDLIQQDDRLAGYIATANLLVDTVHKFQGDERDLMIFSPVVSEGLSPGSLAFLRKTGNLFNVAVTRARSCLIVIGDIAACSNCGVEYLQAFTAYAQRPMASEQPVTELPSDQGQTYPPVAEPSRVSDWERIFYKLLYSAGIRPLPQYTVEQYCLDFAINDGERRLDVEVDGERYHRAWDRELCYRDQIRNQRLIELGWDVMRFWVYQVRDEPDWCVERVKNWMKQTESQTA